MGFIDKIKEVKLRQWLVLIMMGCNTAITYLMGNGPIKSVPSNGDVSDQNRVIITPPGGAFAIWGLIFIVQWIFAVYQLFDASCTSSACWTSRYVVPLFAGFVFTQSMWAILFPFQHVVPCAVFIFALWVFLLLLSILGMNHVSLAITTARRESKSVAWAAARAYLTMALPFSLELGWISAAAPLNMIIVVARSSPDGDSLAPQIGACLVGAVILAVTAFWRGVLHVDVAVAFSATWALAWISAIDSDLPVRVGMDFDNATISVPSDISHGFKDGARALAILIPVFVCVSILLHGIWSWKLREFLFGNDIEEQNLLPDPTKTEAAGATTHVNVQPSATSTGNNDAPFIP